MSLVQIAKKIKKLNLKPELEKNLLSLLKNGQYEDIEFIIDGLLKKTADLSFELSGISDDLVEDEDEMYY